MTFYAVAGFALVVLLLVVREFLLVLFEGSTNCNGDTHRSTVRDRPEQNGGNRWV